MVYHALHEDSGHAFRYWRSVILHALGCFLLGGAFLFEVGLLMEEHGSHVDGWRPASDTSSVSLLASASRHCIPPLHNFTNLLAIFPIDPPKTSHFCEQGDGKLLYEPLPGCPLPLPQSFWMVFCLTTVKGIAIMLLMWTTVKPSYTTFDYVKVGAVYGMTITISFLSLVLLLVKVWQFEISGWHWFECWGVAASMAPWSSNFLLYTGRVGASVLVGFYNLGDADYDESASDELAEYKASLSFVASLVTLIQLLLFLGPFAITNGVPALFLACGCCGLLGACVTTYAGLVTIMYATQYLCPHWLNDEWKNNERNLLIGFSVVPITIAAISIQWMAAVSTYWYNEMGLFAAVVVASTERRSDIYIERFNGMVVGHWVWLVEFVNEVWP